MSYEFFSCFFLPSCHLFFFSSSDISFYFAGGGSSEIA